MYWGLKPRLSRLKYKTALLARDEARPRGTTLISVRLVPRRTPKANRSKLYNGSPRVRLLTARALRIIRHVLRIAPRFTRRLGSELRSRFAGRALSLWPLPPCALHATYSLRHNLSIF